MGMETVYTCDRCGRQLEGANYWQSLAVTYMDQKGHAQSKLFGYSCGCAWILVSAGQQIVAQGPLGGPTSGSQSTPGGATPVESTTPNTPWATPDSSTPDTSTPQATPDQSTPQATPDTATP